MLVSTRNIKAVFFISALFTPFITQATVYGGVDFPDGEVSFADVVVDYDPAFDGNTGPDLIYQVPAEALGIPDHPDLDSDPEYVSLGDGGYIILQFTDNSLTGSDDASDDLWIFEIGPDVENTFVDISKNGIDWFSVGEVGGATSGIDIDAYGWDTSDFFSYVRLTDNPNEGQQGSGGTIGADIDAVGAISSAAPVIPIPPAVWLFGSGLIGLVGLARRKA